MFLYLRPVQHFLFFLTFRLAFSFNYLDVVFLGKAALSIMVCLPSKQTHFLLIFVSLFTFLTPTAHFPSSAYPHLHSSVLFLSFQPFFQLSPPTLSPLWNNKLFPLSFPLTEDVFGPIPERLWHESVPMRFCVSFGHISRGVSSAWSPPPSHQVKPGSVNHVRHPSSIPGKPRLR